MDGWHGAWLGRAAGARESTVAPSHLRVFVDVDEVLELGLQGDGGHGLWGVHVQVVVPVPMT